MPLFGWSEDEIFHVAGRAHSLYLQGRYREAAVIFEGLVAADPESRYCANALAACLEAMSDHARALQYLNRLLARYPDDVEGRVRRCEALLGLSRTEEAAADAAYLRRTAVAQAVRLDLRLQAQRALLPP
jgi:predicted Zn-dependent protease